MEVGKSLETIMLERFLSKNTKENIDLLVEHVLDTDSITPEFEEELNCFYENVTYNETMDIRRYTGYDCKFINAVLRDNWNYEEHGLKTEKKVEEIRELTDRISDIIDKFPKTKYQFMTYRGTTLKEFKKYGINSFEDLLELRDKYLYETGFTSTSLLEETSYFGKKIYDKECDIEVRYIIPEDSNDGMPLITEDLTYATAQNEYLLNRSSLSRVLSVRIEGDKAYITTILIPKHIWNKDQKEQEKNKVK